MPREIRIRFEETLKEGVKNHDEYLELLNITKFIYYTGTRISSTLNFNFDTNFYSLSENMWMLEVMDKGKNGGVKWDKYLVGHALESFKEYCSKRFHIKIDDLEDNLSHRTNYLFPSFNKKGKSRDDLVRKSFKSALIKAGLNYKKFQPTHKWRHTFAQEFLNASNWNYELCASIGGWISTSILKKHYGGIGMEPKLRGLRKSMGLEIREEKHELRW